MTSLTHRFPKWLAAERFEIHHTPTLGTQFMVVLFGKTSARFTGVGQSIAEAAKAASKQREGRSSV
jgi:hypothetical protein